MAHKADLFQVIYSIINSQLYLFNIFYLFIKISKRTIYNVGSAMQTIIQIQRKQMLNIALTF